MKTKKIIKALKTISKVCNKMDRCDKCPFAMENNRYYDCEFAFNSPDGWNIKQIKENLKDIERI